MKKSKRATYAAQGDALRKRILRVIAQNEARKRPPLTLRELGAKVNRSSSVAFHQVRRLREDGLVSTAEGRMRTLTLTDKGRKAVSREG